MNQKTFIEMLNKLEGVYKSYKKINEYKDEKSVFVKLIPKLYESLEKTSYKLVEPFKLGSTATIWKIKDPLNQLRALKLPRPRLGKLKDIIRIIREEKEKLTKLNHQNVIKIYSANEIHLKIDDDDYSFPYIVMDFLEGVEDLDEYIIHNRNLLSAEDIIIHFRDVLYGLSYLHEQSIIHCDIKPGNLLIANGTPALVADLGYSKHFSRTNPKNGRLTQVKYTPQYAHPELKGNMIKSSDTNATIAEIPRKSLRPAYDLFAMGRSIQEVLSKLKEEESSDNKLSIKNENRPIFTQYQQLYLSFIAKRLLDGQVESKLDVIQGLPDSVMSEIKYPNANAALEDFEKLLNLYDLEGIIPELNPNISTYVQIPHCKVPLTSRVEKVISHPTFRRLSRVTQLGFTSYLYPGASHSRFEHALGTFANCCEYIRSLWYDKENCLFQSIMSNKDLELGLIAALLHDIGQYPMSHDLEEITNMFLHEKFNRQLLEKMDHSCGETLAQVVESEWNIDEIDKISEVINAGKESTFRYRILNSIINNPLDCDKLDYLRRDSTHLGVGFGEVIDHERLIRNLTIIYRSKTEGEDSRDEHSATKLDIAEIGVTAKALAVAKSIWRIRQDMFTQVYWHHTIRSLKAMLSYVVRNILINLKDENEKSEFWNSFKDWIFSSYTSKEILLVNNPSIKGKKSKKKEDNIDYLSGSIKLHPASFSGLSVSDDSLLTFLNKYADKRGSQVIELIRERKLYKRLSVISSSIEPDSYDFLYNMFWAFRINENFKEIEQKRQNWEEKIIKATEEKLWKDKSLVPVGFKIETLIDNLKKVNPLILVDIPIRAILKQQGEEEKIRYLPENITGSHDRLGGAYPIFEEEEVYASKGTFDKTIGKIRVLVAPKWRNLLKRCLSKKNVLDILYS